MCCICQPRPFRDDRRKCGSHAVGQPSDKCQYLRNASRGASWHMTRDTRLQKCITRDIDTWHDMWWVSVTGDTQPHVDTILMNTFDNSCFVGNLSFTSTFKFLWFNQYWPSLQTGFLSSSGKFYRVCNDVSVGLYSVVWTVFCSLRLSHVAIRIMRVWLYLTSDLWPRNSKAQ